MLDVALTTLLAPLLVAAATLAARRFGPRIGGVVSAFPAIVGPVLLIDLLQHGAAFTALAAAGTLLGLVTLAAFNAVYGLAASRGRRWPAAFALGWSAAGTAGAVLSGTQAGPLVAAAVAVAALAAAAVVLERGEARRSSGARSTGATARRGLGLPARMATSAMLVVALAAAASALGPVAGGVLAALPILASVLAVFTHRDDGEQAAVALLRGMLGGMAGFVAFCLVVALMVEHTGAGATFAAATAAALAAQIVVASRARPSLTAWTRPRRSGASSRRSASPAPPG